MGIIVRIKPLTLGLTAAALAGVVVLAVTLLRSDQAASSDAGATQQSDDDSPRARLASRLRAHSVPRFETVEPAAPAAPAAPPSVPALVPPPIPAPPPQTPEAELHARASKDGFLFREAGSQTIYIVQNGTKFPVQSEAELRALGYSADRVEEVPSGALNFLHDKPPEKTLMRERDQKTVYYWENGQKRHVTSDTLFDKLGVKWSDVKVVPKGALSAEATGSPIQ
jgi:hypothetical protein